MSDQILNGPQAGCQIRLARVVSPNDIYHRPASKLLNHLLHQSRVLDLEAAPQGVESSRRKIKRQLAENCCLSGASGASDDGEFPAPQTLDNLGEPWERLEDCPDILERILRI